MSLQVPVTAGTHHEMWATAYFPVSTTDDRGYVSAVLRGTPDPTNREQTRVTFERIINDSPDLELIWDAAEAVSRFGGLDGPRRILGKVFREAGFAEIGKGIESPSEKRTWPRQLDGPRSANAALVVDLDKLSRWWGVREFGQWIGLDTGGYPIFKPRSVASLLSMLLRQARGILALSLAELSITDGEAIRMSNRRGQFGAVLSLDLSRMQLSLFAAARLLGTFAPFARLRELSVESLPADASLIDLIVSRTTRFAELRWLRLNHIAIGEAFFEAFRGRESILPHLRGLALNRCRLGAIPPVHMRDVGRRATFPTLQFLSMTSAGLRAEHLRQLLAETGALIPLQGLDLSHNPLGEEGLEVLREYGKSSPLFRPFLVASDVGASEANSGP